MHPHYHKQAANPLSGYFRQAKYQTPLPSGGRWFPPGSVDWPASGELSVMPMTAKDEIALKTPDSLLNGQATVDVIQSCIPAIKDAWHVSSIDLDTLLISIRVATYGKLMEINPRCPKCSAPNDYQADLKEALGHALACEWDSVTEVNGLKIHIRPLSYLELTKKQLRTFEEQRFLDELSRSDLDEETKLKKFNEGFRKLNDLTMEIVMLSIHYIETPDGIIVDDRDLIEDFMRNSGREVFNAVYEKLRVHREKFILPPLLVVCTSCEHEWKQPMDFDNSNFFDLKSSS